MRQMVLLNPQASLPFPGYRVQTTIEAGGAAFTVYKDEMPLVLCVLAINPDDASFGMGSKICTSNQNYRQTYK